MEALRTAASRLLLLTDAVTDNLRNVAPTKAIPPQSPENAVQVSHSIDRPKLAENTLAAVLRPLKDSIALRETELNEHAKVSAEKKRARLREVSKVINKTLSMGIAEDADYNLAFQQSELITMSLSKDLMAG